jgi:hypothetical protein
MTNRRNWLSKAAPAALGVAAVSVAPAQEPSAKDFIGAWTTIHTLPFPPNWFREFLTINADGTVVETNSFLCEAHSQDFSALGLPRSVKGSNGMGNWQLIAPGRIAVSFRKMLFNGEGNYFGDLKATGTIALGGGNMYADWQVAIFNVHDVLVLPLGPATSEGPRIR